MWRALEDCTPPGVHLENLAEVCPAGFAHVLRRCMAMEGDVKPELLDQNLLKWLRGKPEPPRRHALQTTHNKDALTAVLPIFFALASMPPLHRVPPRTPARSRLPVPARACACLTTRGSAGL